MKRASVALLLALTLLGCGSEHRTYPDAIDVEGGDGIGGPEVGQEIAADASGEAIDALPECFDARDSDAEEGPQAHLGYRNVALLGHSLFYPSAGVLDDMARFCGYADHVNHFVEANNSSGGAPWNVWKEYFDETDTLRPEKIGSGLVDGHIKKGGVELLGMTYFNSPDLDEFAAVLAGTPADRQAFIEAEFALRIDSYRKWVDLTLSYNEDSLQKVVIMTPHTVYANGVKSVNRAVQDMLNGLIRLFVDQLRLDYPELEIATIPAGEGIFALWEQYDLGNLPEITQLYGSDTTAIYRDHIHGATIVYELSHLIWMASVYPQLDIRKFDYLDKSQFRNVKGARSYNPEVLFHTWSVDLRQLAYEIVLADPYSGVVDDSRQLNHGPVGEWLASSEVREGALFGGATTSIAGEWYAWDPDGDHGSTPALTLDFGGAEVSPIDSLVEPDAAQTYYRGVWDAPTPGAITVTVGMTDADAASGAVTADITVYGGNAPPSAGPVRIIGSPSQGQTLWGSYSYDDFDGDAESGSTYQWYRSTDAACDGGDIAIPGATARAHTLEAADVGSHLFFEVKPGAATGSSPGPAARSPAGDVVIAGGTHLIQHLDASDPDSVAFATPPAVYVWADQTVYDNVAVPATGTVSFPSASLSASGLAGMDMGSERNALALFDVDTQDTWLDQATAPGGFAVLIAFKADSIREADNDIIGNTGSSGFYIRYTAAGALQARLGSVSIVKDDPADTAVAAGDTVVVGMNYDAATGTCEFWDSLNGSRTETVAARDFSRGTALRLGWGMAQNYMDGMVGEVKIWNANLSADDFATEQTALLEKWVSGG